MTSAWMVLSWILAAASPPPPAFDVVIRGGLLYDGSGSPGRQADVAIRGDRIVKVGRLGSARATTIIDARGLAVAPGFINMLSWSTESLLADGRSQGEVRQGVTTQIFGEGSSMGPLTEAMKTRMREQQGDVKFEVAWTTLAEYLAHLEKKGISQNVASFIGAGTLREHVVGLDDRQATPSELEQMRALVVQEMKAGALGIGSSLIYAPDTYASTDELIALCQAAAPYKGKYISHLRSEGDRLLEAVDELIQISRAAKVPAEIYHLKAAGEANWPKMREAIARIEAARRDGLRIGANMYTYTAGATGLNAAMPPWVQEGGQDAWIARLKDPATRAKVKAEMRTPTDAWENLYLHAGSPERVKFIGFKSEKLKPLTGRTLAEVMAMRGTGAEDTMIDLVIEDGSRVDTAYFLMSEDNVKLGIAQPWVSFGSDAEASAPEGVFLKSSTHPRAYGNFARLLGHYVREERVLTLEDAVHRLTGLPAANWKLAQRGCLEPGCHADLVVFDPATIADHATFDAPQQYATGVDHVFVNGVAVLLNGEHTGAKPGRVVRGPGWARGGFESR